ncbi:MAG TPA: hypothetical protein VKH34_13950 [Vicinamibacterales bacterium]|nr:hypothetical protein [Vicinamibacterales bacterium]
MTRQTMMCAALALTLATPLFAQERDSEQAPVPKPGVPEGKPNTAAAEPTLPRDSRDVATNVRFELTITDQRSEGPAVTKTVTATVADLGTARIRTSGSVRTPMGFRDVILNVDVAPRLVYVNNVARVRATLTIEYRPVAAESDTERSTTPTINESLSVALEDGKSLLISQTADPSTERKVKVEVKATIIR